MKAIIIGGGSIGRRHASNLEALKIGTRIVDLDEIDNLNIILEERFDFGLVCSPSVYHVEHCTILAKHNIPIFCEKPFYTNRVGVEELLTLVNEKNLKTMVGCNLRFTKEVKRIDPTSSYISVYLGFNLTKWRPGTDHLKSYSANKSLGGGILLDAIHELDYLYSKFGKIKNISYIKNRIANITVDTEDLVVGRIEFDNGTLADFTLNYLSEEYQRYYDILVGNTLVRVRFEIDNEMYLDEIKYFVQQISKTQPCINNFHEADYLLKYIV